ncbi:TPA: DUF4956 domain-containing protein [Streptococcus suis]|nr:DUF4956 domain-containing protein [Streptococcus suis]
MQLFNSIFTTSNSNISILQMALTLGSSLGLGILLAAVYKYKSLYSKEFVMTLSLLPTLIAVIIFLVNGNLGTSVAVAGTFSLIKFRSAAGSSKDLLAVFMATAIGLATGMGYIGLAVIVTIVLSLAIIVFENSSFVQMDQTSRHLLVTVDKEFDYDQFFEKNFGKDLKAARLLSIKYKKKKEELVLEYHIQVSQRISDKHILDTLLAAGPKDVVLNKQVPKKKFL